MIYMYYIHGHVTLTTVTWHNNRRATVTSFIFISENQSIYKFI